MSKAFTNVVELIKGVKPKNVCVLLEVPEDHKFGDPGIDARNVRRIEDILDDVEKGEGPVNPSIPVNCYLVTKVKQKEGNAQILPMFAFMDDKIKWRRVNTYDLVIIKCLNNSFLVVKAPENADILPYTKLG